MSAPCFQTLLQGVSLLTQLVPVALQFVDLLLQLPFVCIQARYLRLETRFNQFDLLLQLSVRRPQISALGPALLRVRFALHADLLAVCHREDFLQTGLPIQGQEDALLAQRQHLLPAECILEFMARCGPMNQASQLICHFHHRVDPGSAPKTGVVTFLTAQPLAEHLTRLLRQARIFQNVLCGHVLRYAGGADGSSQSLGHHAVEGTGEQVGFDAHIEQAGHRARGVIGV